jgi:cytoskeletal protein CcmA (bactofilin family)
MPDAPCKVPSHCPHCGSVQQESPHLISTFCRACGNHYKVSAPVPPTKPEEGIIGRAVRKITERPPREINCHHCRHSHSVSGHAKSTICPGCNKSIQLENLTFSSHASRPVDTRGKLTVESGASLTCAHIICGEGLIRGKINGVIFCEGTLRLACQENFSSAITSKTLIIEKGALVDLAQPAQVVDLVVQGHARGHFTSTGTVRIPKHGILEGRLTARSVIVDRGGVLLAESSIRPDQKDLPPSGTDLPVFQTMTPQPA